MSLKDAYQRFLMNPQSASLASDISLIYITTTTRFDGADAIVNHLSRQQKIVKTKSQQIISAIGGSDSLCADVETTLEFVSGGGAYLPSLEDNFLADRVATFPMVHIVRFNDQQQIQQIRLYWDQGSLLKEVEVIGSRGRNWPIRDAKDQARLIKAAYATVAGGAAASASAPATTAAPPPPRETARPVSPTKKHIKDPHAAESLFELLSPSSDRAEPVRAPRAPASAKPAARDYNELFASGDADVPDATPSKARAGSNKNYGPSRLFDLEEKSTEPEKSVKVNPNKYSHFELGDEPDAAQKDRSKMPARPKSRHLSQWDFEDFATPEKPKRESRIHEVRHFGWSDDEPEQTEAPVKAAPRQPKPRRDAETHFALADEEEQDNGPVAKGKRVISSFQNKGQGLYENNLYNEDAEPSPIKPPATNKNAGVSHDHRRKDFDSHWTMTDVSPANEKVAPGPGKNMAADRQKHVQMMESSWDTYDESPQGKVAAVARPSRLRNANQPSWGFGDEQE